MSSDASAAAASPMTNGTVPSGNESHREADASRNPATDSSVVQQQRSLAEVCADLNQRVTSFLTASPESKAVKRTQEQTRISIKVIEKALEDYKYVASTSALPTHTPSVLAHSHKHIRTRAQY